MKLILAIIPISLYVLSCKSTNPHSFNTNKIDTAAILASIDSLGRVVQKAHDTRDDSLLLRTWAKNGVLIVEGTPPVYGRDSIVAKLRNMPSLPEGGSVKIKIMEVQVLSSEWAYVFGIDSLNYSSPGGKGIINETLTFFNLIKKTPEGWQTFREILSPNQ